MTKPFDPFNQCTEYARQIQELLAANAALEAEVLRLMGALEFLNARIVTMDLGGVVERALSTPFTTAALPELIEKAEKLTSSPA